MLALKKPGQFEAVALPFTWLTWHITDAPEDVKTMVSEYNKYLLRHQELESKTKDKKLSNWDIKPLQGAGECLVSRFETDLEVLENSPAFRIHEAEIDLEKCLIRQSEGNTNPYELTALIYELIDSATNLFGTNSQLTSDYFQELFEKLQPYNNGLSQAGFEKLQERLKLATLDEAEQDLLAHFDTKATDKHDRKTVKRLATDIVMAAMDFFENARDEMKTFFNTTFSKLSQLATGHAGKEADLAVVEEVFKGITPDLVTTPIATTPASAVADEEGEEDFETPQNTMTLATIAETHKKANTPESEASDRSPFEDINPEQGLTWEAMQLISDRLKIEASRKASPDDFDSPMPSLDDLADEDLIVQQSLRPVMFSTQQPGSLQQIDNEDNPPSILRSVMASLNPEQLSMPPASMSFRAPYPDSAAIGELESFIDEERLFDGLSNEEALELEQTLQGEELLTELHQEMSLPSEPGSPLPEEEMGSRLPTSLVPPISISMTETPVTEMTDDELRQWHYANPLSPADQVLAAKTWNQCLVETYGQECLKKLPDSERRQLQTHFYQACMNSPAVPEKDELKAALGNYISSTERLFPLTCQALRNRSISAEDLLQHNLTPGIRSYAEELGFQTDSIDAMVTAAELMSNCVPVLSISPYDDSASLPERKQKLLALKEQLTTCNSAYSRVPGLEASNPNLHDLYMNIEKDLEGLNKTLNEHLEVVAQLIENDFSQHENLIAGQQRLTEGALETVEAEIRQVAEALTVARKRDVKKALQSKQAGLALLKDEYQQKLRMLSVEMPDDQMKLNIVTELHDYKHNLTTQLKAALIGSEAINRGLQTALNTTIWEPIKKHYVMRHNGKFRHYDITNIPAGALHWSRDKRVHLVEKSELPQKTDVFKLDHGGRSSMSTTEEHHAVNAWVVRMHAGENKIMSKIRTGVPVPFPLIGRETEEKVKAITVQRLKETIAMMVLEKKGSTDEFMAAVDDPDITISFDAIHTSLLSPDRVRRVMNAFAEKLGKGSKIRALIKKKLDNEAAMHGLLQEAIKELSAKPFDVEFHDDSGKKYSVNVKYDGVLFSCPINKMGQKKVYAVWGDVDKVNDDAALKMFGGTDVTVKPAGRVGTYLTNPKIPREQKILVEKLSRQIQHILANKLHHDDQNQALKLASLLNTLGQYAADGYHDFCKSGKDRTGLENQHAIMTRAQIHAMDDTDIPPLDAPQSEEERFSNQSALACTGQEEIVQKNIAEAGMKIDQGSEPTGEQLYDRAHY